MVPEAEVIPCPQMLTVTLATVALQVRVYVPPEVGPLVMAAPPLPCAFPPPSLLSLPPASA